MCRWRVAPCAAGAAGLSGASKPPPSGDSRRKGEGARCAKCDPGGLWRWCAGERAGPRAPPHGAGPADRAAGYGELDWQKAQEQLGPVRPRWDLAILCNLDPETGRRPKDVLAAVNAQAETERTLSPQVLSARLRCLEQDRYVRHEDTSAAPLLRVYYLLPRGARLIEGLLAIVGPLSGHGSEPEAFSGRARGWPVNRRQPRAPAALRRRCSRSPRPKPSRAALGHRGGAVETVRARLAPERGQTGAVSGGVIMV